MSDAATLREARRDDLPELVRLQAEYYASDGYPFSLADSEAAWARLLRDGSLGRAWVAEASGRVVGYGVLTFGYSLEYRGRDAFVDEVYLAATWRGRGTGRRLLEAIEAEASSHGVKALHLEVERDKPEARGLYEDRGFVAHDRVLMTKDLGRLS